MAYEKLNIPHDIPEESQLNGWSIAMIIIWVSLAVFFLIWICWTFITPQGKPMTKGCLYCVVCDFSGQTRIEQVLDDNNISNFTRCYFVIVFISFLIWISLFIGLFFGTTYPDIVTRNTEEETFVNTQCIVTNFKSWEKMCHRETCEDYDDWMAGISCEDLFEDYEEMNITKGTCCGGIKCCDHDKHCTTRYENLCRCNNGSCLQCPTGYFTNDIRCDVTFYPCFGVSFSYNITILSNMYQFNHTGNCHDLNCVENLKITVPCYYDLTHQKVRVHIGTYDDYSSIKKTASIVFGSLSLAVIILLFGRCIFMRGKNLKSSGSCKPKCPKCPKCPTCSCISWNKIFPCKDKSNNPQGPPTVVIFNSEPAVFRYEMTSDKRECKVCKHFTYLVSTNCDGSNEGNHTVICPTCYNQLITSNNKVTCMRCNKELTKKKLDIESHPQCPECQ